LNLIKYNEIEIESNFGLIKCFNLVFSLKGKLNNIGFLIFLILVIVLITLLIVYFYKGIKPIRDYLQEEMIKNGYIKINKNNNSKNKTNKKIKSNSRLHYPPKKNRNKNNNINNIINGSSRNNISHSKREIINELNNNEFNNINVINDNRNKGTNNYKNKGKSDGNSHILINNVILLENSKQKKSNKKRTNIDTLPTQGTTNNKKEKNIFNFSLININLNNMKKYYPKNSFYILNNYTFEEAIKYDKRSICAIFYIFLLSKQAAFHAFLYKSPLELFPLRFCLLIFIISSDLALNAFFYFDDKISKKYRYAKNLFLFTFSNNLTIILLSTLIGFIFLTLFTNLSNSTNKIRDLFMKEEEKIKNNKKYILTDKKRKKILNNIENILKRHKIKVIVLLVIEVSFILFFWYYVTAFCHVYSKTQMSWLFNSFLSILSRLVIELLYSLGFAKLYIISIESNMHCLYKIVLFFYCFI